MYATGEAPSDSDSDAEIEISIAAATVLARGSGLQPCPVREASPQNTTVTVGTNSGASAMASAGHVLSASSQASAIFPGPVLSVQPNEVWQKCLGCGMLVSMPAQRMETGNGMLECAWLQHGCAASWTMSSIPPGFGSGTLLSVWLKLDEDMGRPVDERSASSWSTSRLPCCGTCGQSLACEQCLALPNTPNKASTHLVCKACSYTYYGTVTRQEPWIHFELVQAPSRE